MVAAAVAGLALLATLIVIWLGDRTVYEPLAIEPRPGSTDVSTRAVVTLRYGRDLDGRTLAGRLRLEPAATGRLAPSGPTARWYPAPALAPETDYSVLIEPGVRSASGQVSATEQRVTFRTRAAQLLLARPEATGINLTVQPLEAEARLVAELEPTARDLAVSPEGDRLAYVAGQPSGPGNDRLWLLNLLTGQRLAVAEPEPVGLGHPAWSPDGQRLVYERRVGRDEVVERFDLWAPPRQLWSAGADGRPLGLLYGGDGQAGYSPLWSATRERLAFFEPNYRAIAIFEGGSPLATIPWNGGTLVGWSPDEESLLVTESAPTPADPARSVVRVLPVDGGPARDLTPADASDRGPAWSPDGAWIALIRSGPAEGGIWLTTPDGREARPLLAGGPWVYLRPAWAADGRLLAFGRLPRDAPGAPPEVWLAFPDGRARQLGARGEIVAWLP